MKALKDISAFFRKQLATQGLTQAKLESAAGVSHQTLVNVLSGNNNYKVTTLLSVADRLGYEMVFVPKAAASGLAANDNLPAVKSRVGAALEKIHRKAAT